MDDVLGDTYVLTGILGEGAMGRVFAADDLVLRRRVAVKTPRGWGTSEQLLGEARALARVRHPNLPVVYGYGEQDSIPYIVMEYLSGFDLRRWIQKSYELAQPLSSRAAVEVLERLADALTAIHAASMIHRDIKPANVLMCEKRGPVLLDMGLMMSEAELARSGPVVGSPAYAAPELIANQQRVGEGHLSDMYAFGVLAFELLTGSLPYQADTQSDLLRAHLDERVPDARELRPDLPEALADLVSSLMAKRRGARPTAEDVLWQLSPIRRRLEDVAAPISKATLIVDDDPDMADLLETLVRDWQPEAEVMIASTGAEALAMLQNKPPTLMLLDVHLPDMTGIELLMRLEGQPRTRPAAIVGVSGKADHHELQMLRHLGVLAFVPKGGDLAERLHPIVTNVLGAKRDVAAEDPASVRLSEPPDSS